MKDLARAVYYAKRIAKIKELEALIPHWNKEIARASIKTGDSMLSEQTIMITFYLRVMWICQHYLCGSYEEYLEFMELKKIFVNEWINDIEKIALEGEEAKIFDWLQEKMTFCVAKKVRVRLENKGLGLLPDKYLKARVRYILNRLANGKLAFFKYEIDFITDLCYPVLLAYLESRDKIITADEV